MLRLRPNEESKSWRNYRCAAPGLIATLAVFASCNPADEVRTSMAGSTALEFRFESAEDRCRSDCETWEYQSAGTGRMVVVAPREPDLVLQGDDIRSVVPEELTGVDPHSPERIVWTARVELSREASERLKQRVAELAPQQVILICVEGEPVDITFPRQVGSPMDVGEFDSRSALDRMFGTQSVRQMPLREVFSRKELADRRQRDQSLKEHERALREIERIQQAEADGAISRDDMLKQLEELTRSAASRQQDSDTYGP